MHPEDILRDAQFVGDIQMSPLALVLKECTVARARKYYPIQCFVPEMQSMVFEDFMASVCVDVEDRAIIDGVADAVQKGKFGSAIVLDVHGVEDVLRKRIPERVMRLGLYEGICPKCKGEVVKHFHEHCCGKCGQALDWDDGQMWTTEENGGDVG